ncbi:hypothetical protein TNCV_575471 [Trichonephila clavipes]|nr:hypothetical protein TNCV_575471 [Trichonephila clavipes]
MSSREIGGRGRELRGLLPPPECSSSKLGWNRAKCIATCIVPKATVNDRRHLALCHDEFRGPRSGLCRSGLSKSEDFISEVLDNAAAVMNLPEEDRQERILR